MQFIANGLNGNYLRNITPPSDAEIDGIMAAIAKGSNFNDEKRILFSGPLECFSWL